MKVKKEYILIILLFITSCEKDLKVRPREYPFLTTKVENVSSEGVSLKSEILFSDPSKTLDEVGFLISETPITNYSGTKMKVTEYQNGSVFSLHLRSGIKVGQKYYLRSYAICDSTIRIIGSQVSFIGMGCDPLPLENIETIPNVGTDGTVLQFRGSNFGYIPDSINVTIAGIKMAVEKIDDTGIYTRIPDNIPAGKYTINITFYNQDINLEEQFEVCAPVIDNYSPKQGFDISIINIQGRFFGYPKTCKTYIHNTLCKMINQTDSTLEVTSPEISYVGMTDIKVIVGGKSSVSNQFEVLGPVINNISPLLGEIGSRILVTGERLMINVYEPVVKVNDIKAQTYSNSSSSLNIIMPLLSAGTYHISLELGKKSVVYSDPFQLEDSWLNNYRIESRQMECPVICQVGLEIFLGFGKDKNEFWKYDITSQSWTELSPIEGLDISKVNKYTKSIFSKDNSIYASLNGSLYEYKIDLNIWTRIGGTDISGLYWTAFYKNNLYEAVDYYDNDQYRSKIYKYDFEENSWVYLYDLSFYAPLFHFVLEDKLYIYIVDKTLRGRFFEFNIEEGILVAKKDYPGNCSPYGSSINHALNINGHGYLIIENNPIDIWEYDPSDNIWIQHQKFPDKRSNVIVFKKEEEIHVGQGILTSNTWVDDIWIMKINE